jgi:hypothetical protein
VQEVDVMAALAGLHDGGRRRLYPEPPEPDADRTLQGMPHMKKTIVNLFTGFLGVGTTALRHLIATRPASEKWAVIVNEFGEVGIDGAAR